MKLLTLPLVAVLLQMASLAMGQGSYDDDPEYTDDLPFEPMAECTRQLAATNDCADVINPNACYNQFKFSGTRTLSCIEGKSDADRARKACRCCKCVGTAMCNWVTTQKYCNNIQPATPTTKKAGRRAMPTVA
ncbi:hypothetical protein QBC37DRAFT_463890 [Rhypophila decipiens]|uniref:Secreted protein n=1 Tax=Rhypophila decipiens TaxID=261697 RepID=A0AAN6Y655_9PEZI|nr:hypothetical protein QBC37DRAFT_463890 [Rhypophila decipiens]